MAFQMPMGDESIEVVRRVMVNIREVLPDHRFFGVSKDRELGNIQQCCTTDVAEWALKMLRD